MNWERLPDETYPAYEAFQLYLTERSFTKVAEELHKSSALIRRWSKQNHWRERADAYDNEINQRAMQKASEDKAAMIERQINIGRMLQGKAANALQQFDFSTLPVKFIPALVEMIVKGAKLERSARELKMDSPQENLFVSTLERVMRGVDDD